MVHARGAGGRHGPMGGRLRGIRAGMRVACMGGHAGLWASASEDGSGHEHRGDGLYAQQWADLVDINNKE